MTLPIGVLRQGLKVIGATTCYECDRMFGSVDSPIALARKSLLSTCTKFIGVACAVDYRIPSDTELDFLALRTALHTTECSWIDMMVLTNSPFMHGENTDKYLKYFGERLEVIAGPKFEAGVFLEDSEGVGVVDQLNRISEFITNGVAEQEVDPEAPAKKRKRTGNQ